MGLGIGPANLATSLPSRNTRYVGISSTLYARGVSGFLSISSRAVMKVSREPTATASTMGRICLQKGDQSALNSNTIGNFAFNTVVTNVSSVISTGVPSVFIGSGVDIPRIRPFAGVNVLCSSGWEKDNQAFTIPTIRTYRRRRISIRKPVNPPVFRVKRVNTFHRNRRTGP